MNKKKEIKQSKNVIPKEISKQQMTPQYSVMFKFWSTPTELKILDMVLCEHEVTHQLFYRFIDTQGRLWKDVPYSDVIIIKEYPNKNDLDDFIRIKFEMLQSQKQPIKLKQKEADVNIG